MRRVRAWLAAPDKMTDRESSALAASCYLVGFLIALAWDAHQERQAFERSYRRATEDFRERIDRIKADLPRPDAEKGRTT